MPKKQLPRRWVPALTGFLGIVCLTMPVRAQSDRSNVTNETGQLLNRYCVSCHNDQEKKGDLRLDQFGEQQWSDYDLIDDMVARLEDGDMPPSDAKRALIGQDKVRLMAGLEKRLAGLDSAQLAGKYKRLTAREYSDTLEDVFGFPVRKLADLPFDSDHEVKRLGEHQVITSYAAKKYYEVAREYLDEHLIHESTAPKETTFTAENGKDLVGRRYTTTQGANAGGGNEPIFILRSPVTNFAEEGVYELMFDWYAYYGPRYEPDKHEIVDPINTPVIRYQAGRTNSEVLNPVEAEKSGNQYLCSMEEPIRIVLRQDMKFLSFRGPHNGFKSYDRNDPRYVKIAKSDLPKEEKRAALKALGKELMEELHGDKAMFLRIKGATFRGPLDKPETPFNVRLFGDIRRTDPIETCFPVIKRVAGKLFRRPVDEVLLQDYYAIAKAEYSESKNCYQAMKATLNSMLCSPFFLFKYEGSEEEFDNYMIATRMSYFLWNGTPDEELMALAAAGKLRDAEVRREQAVRMLAAREKSDRFVANFTDQWLGLHKFGQYTPNEAYIRTVSFKGLKPHLEREPSEFFREILHGNLSALNFIHSDFIVANQPLLSHYQKGSKGIRFHSPKWEKNEDRTVFRRMKVTEDANMIRGGLMTMPAIMSLTTDGENTQPILRGVWIARRMLGIEIEAPATVPAIEVNLENVSKPREILEKHKTDPSCYACHVKFDDFGLAMENYNVIGQWKTDYVHPVQDEKGRFALVTKDPIDSAAEAPDGTPMPGPKGVKEYLMANKDKVMRNLVERLYAYSMGREVRYRDREQIKDLLRGMKNNDYKLRDLVLDLVASESFVRR